MSLESQKRNFLNDKEKGDRVENFIAYHFNAEHVTSRQEQHYGDLVIKKEHTHNNNDWWLEIKFDGRYDKSKNVCFELADFRRSTPNDLYITGIGKHSIQHGNRLIIHKIGTGTEWLIYEPTTLLTALYKQANTPEHTNTPLPKRPWYNGSGKTFGIIYPRKNLDTLPITITTTENLIKTIKNWEFTDTIEPLNPTTTKQHVTTLCEKYLTGYKTPDNIIIKGEQK